MSTKKLWLIRHGQSSINAGVWNLSPNTVHLTPEGQLQAQKAAAEVVQRPDLIIQSPLIRAQESAQYLVKKWPQSPVVVWPIQEINYLSPQKLQPLTLEEKKATINAYWTRSDPEYWDGEGAETFVDFFQRLTHFHEQLQEQEGFVIAIGHGQFFKAYVLALELGFHLSPSWMRQFRQYEASHPMKNSEIFKIES